MGKKLGLLDGWYISPADLDSRHWVFRAHY
jgi:hypothetical protein